MKLQILSFACLILLLVAACNPSSQLRPLPAMLSTDSLPTQTFTINTEKDTTLNLKGGTVISIPARALKPAAGATARIEIKEAITITDILLAGLRTQSDGLPLQSAGMIYINAPGQEITIQRSIEIKMPAMDRLPGMMQFKGQETPNGINWIDPQPLPEQLPKTDVHNGKDLFQQNCASCHAVAKPVTGPALYGAMQRWGHDTAAVFAFTKDAREMVFKENTYACCLFKAYNKQPMPAFPALTQQDLRDLYAYIDQQGKQIFGQVPAQLMTGKCDSCESYLAAWDSMELSNNEIYLNYENNLQGEDTIAGASSDYIDVSQYQDDTLPQDDAPTSIRKTTSATRGTAVALTPDYVDPYARQRAYYSFQVTAFGWHNLDILAKDFKKYEPARLSVSVSGKAPTPSVFLIIPDYKIFVEGGPLKDGKSYGFKTTDGEVPLPMGVKGYIMVISEDDNGKRSYYGQRQFTTANNLSLTVKLEAAETAEIINRIKSLQLEGASVRPDTAEISNGIKSLQLKDTSNRPDPLVNQQNRIWEMKAACSCGDPALPAPAPPRK
ncbi:cytochrome c [Chitinophaga agrisoli]|uniref:Cytochrome c n=1 Tax=Chitinophaga agrisoli TaxID=2607653 RepID=A0A5B2VJU9_9BACT|nr:cytochrome c [Chitinophaga agrisoli]KAA2239873.1 cytochrome c [Chitinophaga agrisoli]